MSGDTQKKTAMMIAIDKINEANNGGYSLLAKFVINTLTNLIAVEKKQIEDAWVDGFSGEDCFDRHEGEEYYSNKYGNQ